MNKRILAYSMLVILFFSAGLVIHADVEASKTKQKAAQESADFAVQSIAHLVFYRYITQMGSVFEANNNEWKDSIHLARSKGDLSGLIQQSQESILTHGDQLFPDLNPRVDLEAAITQGIDLTATSTQIQEVQAHYDVLSNALTSYETAYDNWVLEQVMAAERSASQENLPSPQEDLPVVLPTPQVKTDFDSRARELLQRYGCGDVELSWDASYLPGVNDSGAAAAWDNIIYLNPDMPKDRLDYATAHECAHILQYRAYGNTIDGWYELETSMNNVYGGTGYFGLEQNADCITQEWGYTNTHYTQSCEGVRGDAARGILEGKTQPL